MTARFIVKAKGTDLWLYERLIYSTYGSSHDHSYTWVLSPIDASRFDTVKSANTCAGKGIPKGHWTVHRLLGSTVPVLGMPLVEEEEAEPEPVAVKVEVVERPCWLRRLICGES